MIKKYINHLQKRSYAEKSNVAFIVSIVLTSVVAAVWFLTIFTNPDLYFKKTSDAQNLANTGSLFDSIKEGIK